MGTDFERLLISKGYKKYTFRNGRYEVAKNETISSIGVIDFRYIKDDNEIIFGLHEKGKPTTLIYPRPSIIVTKPNGTFIDQQYDDAVNIALNKLGSEVVYSAIFNNETLRINL